MSLLDRTNNVSKQGPASLLPPPPPLPPRFRWRKVAGVVALACLLVVVAVLGTRMLRPPTDELMTQARAAFDAGQYEGAAIHLRNVLQRDPENAEARLLMGRVDHANGAFVEAEREFTRARGLGVRREIILPLLARALLLQGSYQRVLDEIPAAPEGADAALLREIRTVRGLAYLALDRVEEARALFKEVLDADPDAADALLGNARIAAIERRVEASAALIERALQIDPRNLDGLLMRAQLAWARGQTDDARAGYRKVLERYPANPRAHASLAWLAIGAGRYDAARTHADVALKAAPASPQVNYLKAYLDFRERKYPQARQAIEKALAALPNDVANLLLAGAIAYAQDDFSRAGDLLLRGLGRYPAHLGARKLYAATLAKSGQLTGTLKVLLPTLQVAPEDPELHLLIGQTYLRVGDFESAGQYLEQAAKRASTDAGARIAPAIAQMASAHADPALAALESGLRADAGTGELESLLVLLHLKRGELALADRRLAALVAKRPKDAATMQLQGALLAARKDFPGARKALETALMLEPGFAPAAIGLAKLDLEENDPATARRRLEKLVRADPRKVDGLVALAELAPALKATPEEVRIWLSEANKTDPGAARPAVLLARHLVREKRWGDAIAVVRAAQRNHREDPELLDVLGAAQTGSGDLVAALGTYAVLAGLMPRSVDAQYRLGQMQIANGSDVAGVLTLNRVLAMQPDHEGALSALGAAYHGSARHADALAIARRLQERPRTAAAGHALEGDVLLATGRHAAAAEAFERAFSLVALGRYLMGWHAAASRVGGGSAIDARIERWLGAHRDDVEVRAYWADTLLRRGSFEQAKREYLSTVRRMPDNAPMLNNLAWAMFKTRDPDARTYAERAVKLAPDDPAVLDTMGVILMQDGDLAQSIEFLQRAVARAPELAQPRIHLVQALTRAGNFAKARAEAQLLQQMNLPAAQAAEVKAMIAAIPY